MQSKILYHLGDCIEGMRKYPNQSFDYCFTDPPYNIGYEPGRRKKNPLGPVRNDNLPEEEFHELMDTAFSEVKRLLKPGAALHVCGGWSTTEQILPVLKRHFQLKGCIVWDKIHLGVGWWLRSRHEFVYLLVNGKRKPPDPKDRLPDIWRIPRPPTNRRLHVCEKPVELIQRAMSTYTRPGDWVLDPFAGSAPCAEACLQSGRHFVGWELSPFNYEKGWVRLRRNGVQRGQ